MKGVLIDEALRCTNIEFTQMESLILLRVGDLV
jgi:hypothetical protein